MPKESEYRQFRRLIGKDGAQPAYHERFIDPFLNDATYELTSDNFATPIETFDSIDTKYHNEIIHKAALNWWWDTLSKLMDKHSTSIGQAAQNVSEKWDRALQMIQHLTEVYDDISTLNIDISQGNFSRFSKTLLQRLGGESEEDSFDR